MTQAELIRDLVEKLLSERDKNNKLQSKLEEYKKSKD
ncbi:unknown [Clostridium sp. CAG:470]|nr:unknown [Clostridium sp. CAG:470]